MIHAEEPLVERMSVILSSVRLLGRDLEGAMSGREIRV